MKPEDIKQAPKVFCESINIMYGPECFVMSLSSGSDATSYALTPQHTKRLQQYLTHQITQFEKQNGPINSDWNPQIVSPIQPKKKK